MRSVCQACGELGRAGFTCLACGAEGTMVEPSADELGYRVGSLADAHVERLVRVDAPIAAVLGGGVPERALVLVYGPPGAGKSTEAARLAVALRWDPVYVDAEMTRPECRDVFARAGASSSYLARVRHVTADDAGDAFRAMHAERSKIYIVDSLQKLAPGQAARVALLERLRREIASRAVVVVLAHVNARGRIAGRVALEHEARAVVVVGPDEIRATKCRWALESTITRERSSS